MDEELTAQVAGDGGPAPVSSDELEHLRGELDAMAWENASNLWSRRDAAGDIRYCRWDGQSEDGRKHADAMAGKRPFPFEGASDVRMRTADMIVNERVLVMRAALARGMLQARGLEISDTPTATYLYTFLDWLMHNELGNRFNRELQKLMQYQEGDSPGAGVLGVFWQQETGLRMEQITAQAIALRAMETLMSGGQADVETLQDLMDALSNPAREEEGRALLTQLIPFIRPGRITKVLQAFAEGLPAQLPTPYLQTNQPVVTALRLYQDFFMRAHVTDLQRAPELYQRELLTEVEVREREVSLGWSRQFIRELLEHEAETAFPQLEEQDIAGDFSLADYTTHDPERMRGLYEVITTYRRAVNDDGIPGIYVYQWNYWVQKAAGPRTLLDYPHGLYPFVFFPREVLTSRLLDSRGIPELVGSHQNSQKLLHDSFNDHTQIATVPPIKEPLNRPAHLGLVIGPLKRVKEDRPGSVEFMKPPAYPRSNDKQQAEVRRQVDEYFGRLNPEVPRELWDLHMQGLVDGFFGNLTEAMRQVLLLAFTYYPEEKIARVIGVNGPEVQEIKQKVLGDMDLTMHFDVRNLNMDYIKSLAETLSTMVLPMDSEATVMRDQLVQQMFFAINPNLAKRALRPVESANQEEVMNEHMNFALIAAGVEPPMREDQNHALRLQVLQSDAQAAAETVQNWPERNRNVLRNRMEHLGFQVQQRENAVIGRMGTAPVEASEGA